MQILRKKRLVLFIIIIIFIVFLELLQLLGTSLNLLQLLPFCHSLFCHSAVLLDVLFCLSLLFSFDHSFS
jgi:hypothetical protein